MNWIEIVLLGIIQGLTEFLPVSSSGHLVVASAIMVALGGTPPPELLELEICLHLGTLLAILIYYRERIFRLLGQDRRVLGLLAIGTLPAVGVVLGLAAFDSDAGVLHDPLVAGPMFLVTAGLLIAASRCPAGDTDYTQMTWKQALCIGLFQGIAILPGISRSGATITAGLLVGVRRDSATTFSFLLAIPAIGGAGVLEGLKALQRSSTATPLEELLLGTFVSFLVGLAALHWMVQIVAKGRVNYFALWLIPFGIAVTAWQISNRFF